MITNPIGTLSLSKREILRFLSVSSQTIFPPLISSALFLYIFGVAIGSRLDFSQTGLSYFGFIVPGLMTLHLITSAYENTTSSLFIARWHNHIQEILLSPLSYFEMVLGLLAGGVMRGVIVALGVYLVSTIFSPMGIVHPIWLMYFIITIATIFSCAGMVGALWAEDFGMLSVWNIYVIVPLVFMGGVFHPMTMLPKTIQAIAIFNPMYYLIEGVRFSVTGVCDISVWYAAIYAFVMAVISFFLTVYLFKVGYKLRT